MHLAFRLAFLSIICFLFLAGKLDKRKQRRARFLDAVVPDASRATCRASTSHRLLRALSCALTSSCLNRSDSSFWHNSLSCSLRKGWCPKTFVRGSPPCGDSPPCNNGGLKDTTRARSLLTLVKVCFPPRWMCKCGRAWPLSRRVLKSIKTREPYAVAYRSWRFCHQRPTGTPFTCKRSRARPSCMT